MMDNSGVHDYSTNRGRLHLLSKRLSGCKWTLLLVALAIMILFSLIFGHHLSSSSSLKESSLPQGPTHFEYVGKNSVSMADLERFTDYEELMSRAPTLTTLTLHNIHLNAPSFSRSLTKASQLQEIVLDNVSLMGNFTPVLLPNLMSLSYNQHPEDKRDTYKSPETLKKTLFFEKVEGRVWDVERGLLNLGVELKVSKGGTKLLEINRPKGIVHLNVKYCETLLLHGGNITWISTLSLITCNITTQLASVIPPTLKYLNMRNAIPSSQLLKGILAPQKMLEQFYGYLNVYSQVSLNLGNFPPTMKKLGVNNLDISVSPLSYQCSVRDLSMGDFLSPQIVADFQSVFPNVSVVQLFNVTEGAASPLLRHVLLQTMNVEDVFVVGLVREENFTEIQELKSDLGMEQEGVYQISDFQIINAKSPSRSVSILTQEQQDRARYEGLGFDVMDTYEDYLKWDSLTSVKNMARTIRFTS